MRLSGWMALLVIAASLAGCVQNGPPTLQLSLESDEVHAQGQVRLHVSFTNDNDEPFVVDGPQGCIHPEARAKVDGTMVLFDWPAGELLDCTSDDPKTIAAGDTRTWDLVLDLGQARRGGVPLFQTGQTYPVLVDLVGVTSWNVASETAFRVSGDGDLPRIEVQPEKDEWRAGETREIRATFVNTAGRAFTYTSSDTCNDIRVWVEDAQGEGTRTMLQPEGGGHVCGQALTPFEIKKGQTVEVTVVWDGSQDGQGGAPFVAPGTYVVRADFDGTEHAWETEGMAAVSIRAST